MDILTTLPTDSFVTAALSELLEDVTNLLSAAQSQKPLDKDEISFWRRQLNALNKAESYFVQGVRPIISGTAYLLASASRPGALIHRLTRHGGIVVCSCEAGVKGTLCWHHMLINVIERAAELESLSAPAVEDVSSGPEQTPEAAAGNPIPHAAEAAAWLTLQQRLDATARLLDAMRAEQQRLPPQHIAHQARAAYARAREPTYRRPLFAERDAETFRRHALAEERAVLLEARARRSALSFDPPVDIPDEPPPPTPGGPEPGEWRARQLGWRLASARKKSAYFAGAFYLEAA